MSDIEDSDDLEETLQRLQRVYAELSKASPIAKDSLVDMSVELKPHLRRLFSGDMLWCAKGQVEEEKDVEVTLEVRGDGEDITSMFVLFELEPVDASAGDVVKPNSNDVSASASPTSGRDTSACLRCGKALSATGADSKVLGSSRFHAECFVCHECNCALVEGQCGEHSDGNVYCKTHLDALPSTLSARNCGRCGEAISGKGISAMGKTFHEDCHAQEFVCKTCGRSLQSAFVSFRGELYCTDHNPTAATCAACNEPLSRQVIAALDRKWHPHCFVCEECKKPFDGGLFFKVDGKPFCSEHAMDDEEDEDEEYSGESEETGTGEDT